MKRLILGFALVVAVAIAVPLASATPRSGTLKVDKECSGYTGGPGSYCTFYASNVEFYLFREDTFGRFITNLTQVPHADNAVIVRSFFGRASVAPARQGDNSVSQAASIDDLLRGVSAGRIHSYFDLAGR